MLITRSSCEDRHDPPLRIDVTGARWSTCVEKYGEAMVMWKRFALTFVAMLVASLIVGFLWREAFDARIPSYLSGGIGGLAALASWELLKRK